MDVTARRVGPIGVPAAICLALAVAGARAADRETPPRWPLVTDHVQAWWREGFPGRVPDAPWHWCVRGGRWALVLDTAAARVRGFGPVPAAAYGAGGDEAAIDALAPADLHLVIEANGTTYRCIGADAWDGIRGPRIVEAGRWLQRSDINGLVFESAAGERLAADSRLETTAWPDHLAFVLAARPALRPIVAGEGSFGRVGGGFGLDGSNHLEIPHAPALDPERFTLELWVYPPPDFGTATKATPWLVCKNGNEAAVGNFGITLDRDACPRARLAFGRRPEDRVTLAPRAPLVIEAWNHLAMSYDGDTLRLFVNGACRGEQRIGRPRPSGTGALAIGRRQDANGDGYHVRAVVDEIRLHDRPLTAEEIRGRFTAPDKPSTGGRPVYEEGFRGSVTAATRRPPMPWNDVVLSMRLAVGDTVHERRVKPPPSPAGGPAPWDEAAIAFEPESQAAAADTVDVAAVAVDAAGAAVGDPLPVVADAIRGWQRIDLDGVRPILPAESGRAREAARAGVPRDRRNDALERVRITITNPGAGERTARLLLAKTGRGLQGRVGSTITGISAVLRDTAGHPLGIPVQLSKNWHGDHHGEPYAGNWFHGFTCLRIPANATVEVEAAIACAHWGGVPAASHAQLSLAGWGSNQLWDESAIGAWGETICHEPDQVQRACSILDVRPLLVRSGGGDGLWNWTGNVGGGDFLRIFDAAGARLPHAAMRTTYVRQGPCLTEVVYAGRVGEAIRHSETVSLARTDDVVRGVYRLRMDVDRPVDVSRCVIFQVGADTYSYARERRLAVGDAAGLGREWDARWGGDAYRTEPIECGGNMPWVSLHGAVGEPDDRRLTVANRGVVIREWRARLGGRDARPWVAERGLGGPAAPTSTIDVLPPPGVKRLEAGDFVEAVIEHLVLPQSADDYYGPNASLREALAGMADTWRLVHREAAGNDRTVDVVVGRLERTHPDVRVAAVAGRAEFRIGGGLGHVPITVTGLASHRGGTFMVDGAPIDQQVHGNDFWQADHDAVTGTWSQTVTVPLPAGAAHVVRFASPEP